jgi:hypothetical protein
MNIFQIISAVIGIAGGIIGITGIARIIVMLQRKSCTIEKAPPKQSPGLGVLYAFTMGMAPWSKESVRIHWLAYMRGIAFHICTFIGIAWIIASPWAALIPWAARLVIAVILGIGAILGFAGYGVRQAHPGLKMLSTPDDYFAIGIVSIFLVVATISALITDMVPLLWIISGLTAAYIPFGKLRHFIYFFYSRSFLGMSYGSRGALEL